MAFQTYLQDLNIQKGQKLAQHLGDSVFTEIWWKSDMPTKQVFFAPVVTLDVLFLAPPLKMGPFFIELKGKGGWSSWKKSHMIIFFLQNLPGLACS